MATQANGLKRKLFIRSLAVSLAASASMLAITPALAQGGAPMALNIPAQPASDAIRALARRTGTQILFDNDRLRRIRSRAVNDVLTARQALAVMLEGSGFEVADTPSGALVIRPTRAASGAADRASPRSGESQAGSAAADDESAQQDVVVTGTIIRGSVPQTAPVNVYTREEIQRRGAGNLQQFFATLPENFSVQSQSIPTQGFASAALAQAPLNNARGAGVNIHGIGVEGTLTLLNGRRLAGSQNGAAVDISMIPVSAIERVEVLTDGGSATYGADAVAGVVNISLRRSFDGLETSIRYARPTDGGTNQINVSQIIGRSWSNGGVIAGAELERSTPLSVSERRDIPSTMYLPTTDIQPSNNRKSGFVSAHYDISPSVRFSADAIYSERSTVADGDIQYDFGAYLSRVAADTSDLSVGAGVDVDLGGDWVATASGSLGMRRETVVNTSTLLGSTSTSTVFNRNNIYSGGVRASGSLVTLPGGALRVGLGAEYRHEENRGGAVVTNLTRQSRQVRSVFGEALIPLVGSSNALPFLHRAEISLGGRYDDYSDFGGNFSPRIGALVEPVDGVRLRGSFGRSFRPPFLTQLVPLLRYRALVDVDPVTGVRRNYISDSSNNPDLGPQRSRSWTLGFDIEPVALPGLKVSGTWFSIDYFGKIDRPPAISGSLFSQATLAPFLDRTPDPAVIAAIYALPRTGSATFTNSVPAPNNGPGTIVAIFDNRPQNIARNHQSGFDLSVDYATRLGDGRMSLSLSATKLLDYNFQTTVDTPLIDILGILGQPADFRMRGAVNYSRRSFFAGAAVNYTASYDNPYSVPATRISSWTTVDARVGFRPEGDRGLGWSLSVTNLFDRNPPRVVLPTGIPNAGFDSNNANIFGRVVALEINARW